MNQPRLAWLAEVDSKHDDDEDQGLLMAAVVDMLTNNSRFYELPWNQLQGHLKHHNI